VRVACWPKTNYGIDGGGYESQSKVCFEFVQRSTNTCSHCIHVHDNKNCKTGHLVYCIWGAEEWPCPEKWMNETSATFSHSIMAYEQMDEILMTCL
jgi:hypothetical protein